MAYKFDSPFKAAARTRNAYPPSKLKQRRGEDAYREAHSKARAEGKDGFEAHEAGLKAQRSGKTAFGTDDWLAF